MFYSRQINANYRPLVVLLFIVFGSFAVEAEESAEGEAATEVIEKKLPSERDYRRQIAKLNSAKEQTSKLRKEIKELIDKKNKTKKESVKKKIINDIVGLHEELKKQIQNYNEQHRIIKYTFPRKGDRSKKSYLPLRVDTLEEIEQGVGLEADLTRVRKKVENKYAPFVPKKDFVEHKLKVDDAKKKKKKTARDELVLEQ